MSELEFDLLGAGYAAGLSRTLTATLGQPVDVRVTRYHGHLYSTLASGGQHEPFSLLEPTTATWAGTVVPRLAEHVSLLRELVGEKAAPGLTRAKALFAECIAFHHAMLIPAREAIGELAALAAETDGGGRPSSHATALDAVTVIA